MNLLQTPLGPVVAMARIHSRIGARIQDGDMEEGRTRRRYISETALPSYGARPSGIAGGLSEVEVRVTDMIVT